MNFSYYGIINAKKYPQQEFLVELTPSKGQRRFLTWKDFNEQTNKVANYLQKELGVQKGDYILHLQMNSLEWIVTFHAILRVGAVAVPLNFRFASMDIKYAAEACNPKVFILGDGFLPKVQPVENELKSVISYICIGKNIPNNMVSYDEIMENSSPEDVLVEVDGEDPAELMFTSGTTGPPKPVCQAHENLYQIGIGNALTYGEGHETVYLAPHPFYHSGSFFLSFPSYLAGGKIIILLELNNPRYLLDTICQEKVNNGWVTVPTMSDTVNAVKKGEIDISKYDFSHVTGSIVIGAQPVPSSLFEDMKKYIPFKTGNIYGITEGGGGGTINLYDEDVLKKPGSIGKGTFNVETRVVDENGKMFPLVKWELLLKGRNMKEYFKNPDLTNKIVVDGWLYTGDLVRVDEEAIFILRIERKISLSGKIFFPLRLKMFCVEILRLPMWP